MKKGQRIDWSTTSGLFVGFGLILLGQALEGGSVRSVVQWTAAMIVLGGTFGAVMVSFTTHHDLWKAVQSSADHFRGLLPAG